MRKKVVFLVMKCILALILVGLIAVIGIDGYVTSHVSSRIITPEQAQELKDVDCILVLGCLVKDNGTPSDMLHDRLRRGVELYQTTMAPKLLMSGDHGRTNYDEVAAMKQFAVDAGVPSSDVFMDHAGFSTYESIYRARDIFKADKIIIVSQEYHLYRALYIAEQLGVEAYGVSADYRNYSGQTGRDIREILARVKDVLSCIFQLKPTYLGNVIPVSGDGDVTNDQTFVPTETEVTQPTENVNFIGMTDEELLRRLSEGNAFELMTSSSFVFPDEASIQHLIANYPEFAELYKRDTMLETLNGYGKKLAESYLASTDPSDRYRGSNLQYFIEGMNQIVN